MKRAVISLLLMAMLIAPFQAALTETLENQPTLDSEFVQWDAAIPAELEADGNVEAPVAEVEMDLPTDEPDLNGLEIVYDEETEAVGVIEEAADLPARETDVDEGTYHILTFDYCDGTGTVLQAQFGGKEVTAAPDDPTWEGHVFEGWFNDPVVGRQFAFGNILYADQTLYAHWSADDWKISQWFKQLVRGGSNIHYDEETRTLAIDAGELTFTKHDGSEFNGTALEAGYYMGFQIQAPTFVTDEGELYRIETDGEWKDFNGPNGIRNGVSDTGCLYLNVYEPIDLAEIKALADQNALKYVQPATPGNRDNLVIEEESTTGGRGRGSSNTLEEAEFTPYLKTWTYRIAKAGMEDENSEAVVFTVTLDPRHIQLKDGNDLRFFIQGYRYRFRVKFNLDGGTGEGNYNSQILLFGEQAEEPVEPVRKGYTFDGWYTFWEDGDEVYYNDWAYNFHDRMGVRSSFTLRAKWQESVQFVPTLNLVSSINMFVYIYIPEGEDPADYSARTTYNSYIQTINKTESLINLRTDEFDGKTYYAVDALHAGSDEMTDIVTVTVFKGNAEVAREQYSIRSIAEERLTEDRSEIEKDLYRAMLQYGHYAQKWFGNHSDDLPSTEDAPVLVDIPDCYAVNDASADFAQYISAFDTGLALDSSVDMNVYLTPAKGYGLGDFEISITDKNGNNYRNFTKPTVRNGEITFKIMGVYTDQMSDDFNITVKLKNDSSRSATWTRSLVSGAYKIQERGPDEDLLKLVQALYQYHLTDAAYWAQWENLG